MLGRKTICGKIIKDIKWDMGTLSVMCGYRLWMNLALVNVLCLLDMIHTKKVKAYRVGSELY